MIVIGILYVCIVCYEWRYMKHKKRKKRTFQYVLGTAALLFLCFEALYYFREQWTIAEGIQTVFGPIEKIIRMEK
ncbi:hypothetical protein [Paenibacillus kobensis]|uniref:hypothetical protein n=1 Tax=Paenibacillus kobensis TaxID=59841 RepID=UPI000FD87A7D|nr:hypothetical protein [Paenibacillus kobensis]